MDISEEQDLSIAIMNLISIEEHLAFNLMKTKKKEYIVVLNSVRKLRKELLKKIVVDPEAENWCISKHLLAATMRLMETGAKYLETKPEKAAVFYKNAFDLYNLFWLLQKVGKNEPDERNREESIEMEAED